jgi:mannosyl-oligosaccharide glucosidase
MIQSQSIDESEDYGLSRRASFKWKSFSDISNDGIPQSLLDDYPRGKGDPSAPKMNLDLHCWIAIFVNEMALLSKHLGKKQEFDEYMKIYKHMTMSINQDFFDMKHSLFMDIQEITTKPRTRDYYGTPNRQQTIYSPHIGYANVMPLIGGLYSEVTQGYKNTLKLIGDRRELFSEFGIRSLSRADELYDENYGFRGAVRLEFNFLILKSLRLYYFDYDPDSRELYLELRQKIIEIVFREWKIHRLIFEKYNSETGEGSGNHLSGLQPIVLMIINEDFM